MRRRGRRRARRRAVVVLLLVAGAAALNRSLIAAVLVYRVAPWAETWLPRVWLAETAAGVLLAGLLAVDLAGPGPRWPALRRRAGRLPQLAELDADDTGRLLEDTVAQLLERDGCELEVEHGGGGDEALDGLAIAPDGQRVAVQCKAYVAAVTAPDLYEFNGTRVTVHRADVSLYVTTSRFTAPALRFARKAGITPVDGRQLVAWIAGSWSPIRELQAYPRREAV